jgi:hypothetical protein
MYFHAALRVEENLITHTLEWPWFATWVCAQNATHISLIDKIQECEICSKIGRPLG